MKQVLKLFLCLYVLLSTAALHAENVQQQSGQDYFENYPSSWTTIVPNGATIVVANSEKRNIQVKIRTYTEQIGKSGDHKTAVNRSRCKYDYCIDIVVNGKQIIVPHSVFCDLVGLNRAKVFIEGKKSILMLDGGDASIGYYVKIEFDSQRVTRKAQYAGSSMSPNELQAETIYHLAVD